MSKRFGPIYETSDYAGFIRRTLALVLDAIILLGLWFAAAYGWYSFAPVEWITEQSYRYIFIAWYLFSAAYIFGLRLSVRGTLGYRLVGIRYAYMLAEKPTRTALAFRALLAPVLMWFFALDHIWIIADKRKQAWHDKMSGFFVVKRKAEPVGECQMVQRVINFILLTFVVWEPLDTAQLPETTKQADP